MLKKDLLELCLLHLMAQGDQYGYDLLRQLHAAFPDTQESAIYAILRGLCRGSFTERCQGEASGGPERKYYRLTEAGSARYGDLRASWRGLREALSALGIQ